MQHLAACESARNDLLRLADFLAEQDRDTANATADLIVDALSLLQRHSRVGRRVMPQLRELVIQRGRTGCVALYRVDGGY